MYNAKHILYVFIFLLLVSCQKEEFTSEKDIITGHYGKELAFGADMPEEWNGLDTRSSTSSYTIANSTHVVLEEEIEGLRLVWVMEEHDGIESEEIVDTAIFTRASSPISPDDVLDMGVYAYVTPKEAETAAPDYDSSRSEEFMINQHVDISDGYSYAPVKYWPGNGYWVNFFGYRPYIDNVNKGENTYLTLYSSERDPMMKYTVPADVDDQVDLLASSLETLDGTYNQTVIFEFAHLLSAVRFKVGSIPAKVTEVALKNVAKEGISVKMRKEGVWTAIEGSETFSQSGLDVPAAGNSGKQIGKMFYMLPQLFEDSSTSEISLTIVFDETREYTLTRPIKDFCDEWKQGKTYTFTLTTPKEVEVKVEDEIIFEGDYPVKQNVTIMNTGISEAYIRATIIGNWVLPRQNTDGSTRYDIIAGWYLSDEMAGTGYGEMIWGTKNNNAEPSTTATSGWRKGPDGYYYFLKKIPAGGQTDPLFDKYKLKSFYPLNGSELELIIAVEAIHPKDIAMVWPESIRSALND